MIVLMTAPDAHVGRARGGDNPLVNLLRVGAALMVVISHARIFLLEDYSVVAHDPVTSVLYGVTALGHEAVVVFFVLSGYWVGGSALRKIVAHGFSWRSYLVDRLSRLWIVLIPALALTLILSAAALLVWGDLSPYAGDTRYSAAGLADRMTPIAFIGNIMFLGGIYVPPFGLNEPLWSLGFEFWMYILAPLLVLAVVRRSRASVVYLIIFGTIGIAVGPAVTMYFPIWAAGMLVAHMADGIARVASRFPRWAVASARLLSIVAVFGVSIGCRLLGVDQSISNYLVAVPALLLLVTLAPNEDSTSLFRRSLKRASRAAHSSFSVYAIHQPILIIATAALGLKSIDKLKPDLSGWAVVVAVVASVMVLGWLFSLLSENHTDRVRRWLKPKVLSWSTSVNRPKKGLGGVSSRQDIDLDPNS